MTVAGMAVSKLLAFSDELRDHSFAAHARDVRGAVLGRPQPARRGLRQPADRRADRRRRRVCGRGRDRPVRRARRAEAAHRERRVERAARAVAVPLPRVLPGHGRRRHVPRRPRGRHGVDAARGRAAPQRDHRARRRGAGVVRPVRRLARRLQPADGRSAGRGSASSSPKGEQPLVARVDPRAARPRRLGGEVRDARGEGRRVRARPGRRRPVHVAGRRRLRRPARPGPGARSRATSRTGDHHRASARARSTGCGADHDALRRARLERAEPPARDAGLARGEPVGRIGLALVLARGATASRSSARAATSSARPTRTGRSTRRRQPARGRRAARPGCACTPTSSSCTTSAPRAAGSTRST